MPGRAKGYGGERGWRKGMADEIGQERKVQYAWVLGIYLYCCVCGLSEDGNPQVIGIGMAERGARDGEMVSVPKGSEDEISQTACKSFGAGSQG